ncbi:hypothetical protein AVEN_83050-1 [Araneus ventricosus]|uniref:Uncharacterized protein n=1 Tax=Araneus ventricosus TaxID=182803 RepID=A0A4Y2APM0_ARAVE|nr:hypothetical protein AVEN_83050-1 [Araneus ventricosus]
MCTRATDTFALPYKTVVKNRHPPADLFKLLENPVKRDTSSFPLSILKELDPPAQDTNPSPRHSHLSQEQAISNNEIKRILEKAPL